MARHRSRDDPRAGPHAAMLLAAVAAGACAALAWTAPTQSTATAVPAESDSMALVAAQPAPVGPRPVRIEIPAIGVAADLVELHRTFEGELSTPTDWADAGWYAEGVVPGERGPAVIVGHLDSAADGPAVFYRLPLLNSGDQILVTSSDGTTSRFVVETSERFSKAHFPTPLVYGPTALPELRLITCTGTFDPAAGSYRDNLVVTAYAS